MKNILLAGIVAYALIAITFAVVFSIVFPLRYRDEIRTAANQFNVDKVLIASIIRAESGFDSMAMSPKGAVGLMQVLPTTAAYVNERMNLGLPSPIILTDPTTNITIGTAYLRYLLDRFGDTRTAIIAYNAGEGRVAIWLREKETTTLATSPYPATNAYVQRVLNGLNMYRFRLR